MPQDSEGGSHMSENPPKEIRFRAMLEKGQGWLCLYLPKSAGRKIGTRGKVPVVGTINGVPIRTSVFPTSRGQHMMLVNKQMQKTSGVMAGDCVSLVLAIDDTPRIMEVPLDLERTLKSSRPLWEAFDRMSYSHKREWVDWINSAKKQETRARRIAKVFEKLAGKRKMTSRSI